MFCSETIDDIVANLHACSSGLAALNSSTEDDFLTTGAELREVAARAGEISTAAKAIADLVSGAGLEGHREALQKLFDQMRAYLDLSGRKLNSNTGTLRTILGTSDDVALHLVGFKRIVKHLRVLGISTKIESARLAGGNNAFANIADDVEKLSGLINAKSADILRAVTSSHKVIGETLSKVSLYEERGQGRSQTMLDDIVRNLSSLSEKHERSSIAAQRVVSQSDEISRSIGDIVGSLQFHDITRQQIEHVTEAMDALGEKMSRLRGTENALSAARDLCVSDVCRLQMNQLESAKREFVSAVGGSMDCFRTIAGNVVEISKEAAALVDATGAAGSSFLTRLKADVAEIVRKLKENGEANQGLLSAVESVAVTITDLAAFVGSIEEIGVDIGLLALNAQIRAAQTGSEGAALGVLAEAVRKLSEDARGQTLSISEALTHISSSAQGLRRGGTDEDEIPELNEMVERFGGLLDALEGMDGEVASCINRMEGATKEVETRIRDLISAVRVHETMESSLSGAVAALAKIDGKARQFGPPTGEVRDAGYLKQLEDRYTMHKERSIHRSIINTIGPMAPFPDKEPEGGLGENVELF
jgi:methyl-accepting chemotaxis protein